MVTMSPMSPITQDRPAHGPGVAASGDTSYSTESFVASRLNKTDVTRFRRTLHVKALSIVVVFLSGYLLLLTGPHGPWSIPVGCFLIVNSLLAAATGIMHDANHHAFSSKKSINAAASCVADLLGASSWLWRFQHNLAHHRHTNVVGLDDDIEQMPFLRLTDNQKGYTYMRYQHFYAWALYAFLTVKWLLVGDFLKISSKENYAAGSVFYVKNKHRAAVIIGKMSHVSWALVLPMFFHGWASVSAVYLVCAASVGVVLATVFQLAHCVEKAEVLSSDHGLLNHRGFEHQVRTTVNVRWKNKFSRTWAWWLLGGLDHQIEHHIAPRSPHTAYRSMSAVVREECAKRGLEYKEHDGLLDALKSHYRHLRRLSRPTEVAALS